MNPVSGCDVNMTVQQITFNKTLMETNSLKKLDNNICK